MTTLRLPLAFRNSPRRIWILVIAAVLLGGYLLLLNHEEQVMEDYYDTLRRENVELYLMKVRQAHGFRTFLKEYLTIHDYGTPKVEVPPFMVGRWALFAEEKRVSDAFLPESCLNSLEIEDGQVKRLGETTTRYPAAYTMSGSTLTAHLDTDETMAIKAVGYGSHLHHIEVTLPGENAPRYGYMCR